MSTSQWQQQPQQKEDCVVRFELNQDNIADFWLLGVIVLPVIVFGFAASAISVFVFSRKSMRKQLVNIYLLALGICDCCFLSAFFVTYTVPRMTQMTDWMWPNKYIQPVLPLSTSLTGTAQLTSIWITVGMCMHRMIGCWFPLQAKRFLTVLNVCLYLVLMMLVWLIYSMVGITELRVDTCSLQPWNITLPWARQELKSFSYYRMRASLFIVFAYVFPFSLLLVGNTFVLLAIQKSRRFRSRAAAQTIQERCESAARRDEEMWTSIMLVLVVVVFMFNNAPFLVFHLLSFAGLHVSLHHLFPFVFFCVISNPLLNAVIYWVFFPRYRKTVTNLLKCRTSGRGLSLRSKSTNSSQWTMSKCCSRRTATVSVVSDEGTPPEPQVVVVVCDNIEKSHQ